MASHHCDIFSFIFKAALDKVPHHFVIEALTVVGITGTLLSFLPVIRLATLIKCGPEQFAYSGPCCFLCHTRLSSLARALNYASRHAAKTSQNTVSNLRRRLKICRRRQKYCRTDIQADVNAVAIWSKEKYMPLFTSEVLSYSLREPTIS